jgi:hypothetical protein
MNLSSYFFAKLSLPVVLLALVGFPAEASDLWEFVRVGKGNEAKPTWAVHAGKAQIEDDGQHLEIFAYYDGDAANGRDNPRDIARIVIRGTIGVDRTIQATGTLLNTDANPWKLRGRYTVRTEHETWGNVRKVVTYKEIVFSRPPNTEFLGFLGHEAHDE